MPIDTNRLRIALVEYDSIQRALSEDVDALMAEALGAYKVGVSAKSAVVNDIETTRAATAAAAETELIAACQEIVDLP